MAYLAIQRAGSCNVALGGSSHLLTCSRWLRCLRAASLPFTRCRLRPWACSVCRSGIVGSDSVRCALALCGWRWLCMRAMRQCRAAVLAVQAGEVLKLFCLHACPLSRCVAGKVPWGTARPQEPMRCFCGRCYIHCAIASAISRLLQPP